jgi:hypothetical protein
MHQRDLDSNIIRLAPGASIGAHAGPDLDVLLLVLHGTGHLSTEIDTIDLHPGALIWLPQRSRRQFTAGPHGLSYLTVHQRRQSLILNPAPPHDHTTTPRTRREPLTCGICHDRALTSVIDRETGREASEYEIAELITDYPKRHHSLLPRHYPRREPKQRQASPMYRRYPPEHTHSTSS